MNSFKSSSDWKKIYAGGIWCKQAIQTCQEEEESAKLAWLLPTQIHKRFYSQASHEGNYLSGILLEEASFPSYVDFLSIKEYTEICIAY